MFKSKTTIWVVVLAVGFLLPLSTANAQGSKKSIRKISKRLRVMQKQFDDRIAQLESIAAQRQALFGDGSSGNFVVAESGVFSGDATLQYENFTVEEGVTLQVHSGTVLRCSGEFVNHGTIEILPAVGTGGESRQFGNHTNSDRSRVGERGVSVSGASPRDDNYALPGSKVLGGVAGLGLSESVARGLLDPGLLAGGGGGGAGKHSGDAGDGGGSFLVKAARGVTNSVSGVIRANGGDGSPGTGGGAGGLIILSSGDFVVNAGVLRANGGVGGGPITNVADRPISAGGGGGGGIIHLVAPAVSSTGTLAASGGEGGAETSPNTFNSGFRYSGTGGGACGGDGGAGGEILSDDSSSSGQIGGDGYIFLSESDPTALF